MDDFPGYRVVDPPDRGQGLSLPGCSGDHVQRHHEAVGNDAHLPEDLVAEGLLLKLHAHATVYGWTGRES